MAKSKSVSTSSKKSAAPGPEADPRFFPVAAALGRTAGFSLMESKSGALRGLMLNGKSFGMSTHGRFVLKMNEERVAALVADGVGAPFRATGDRVMKGWIEVTSPKADWVALAKEACRLAAAGKPIAKKLATPKKRAIAKKLATPKKRAIAKKKTTAKKR